MQARPYARVLLAGVGPYRCCIRRDPFSFGVLFVPPVSVTYEPAGQCYRELHVFMSILRGLGVTQHK